ncbi:hypothetical protein GJ496_011944 [Pomphorhynchus laevis]|nr:hypothetical protein GJ496_011944 [Pomphorhynchus laevis]
MESLIELPEKELAAMRIGLAHSLSRYKLKFSPDKIDTMIVQAISLLDDLDKELNNYIMRCREWYSWHFPELSKLIEDNSLYCKVVNLIGMRTDASHTDLESIVDPELAQKIIEASEVSIGTEISEEDICNIKYLAQQNRMNAVAPNLTVLVGESVGARLIARAGSLVNLAKHPASTVQILGAEKALFRALKTKHDTPKYGLIYHASLVGKCGPKLKGKMSRMLAAKSSLAARVDALGDGTDLEIGVRTRASLEERLGRLEECALRQISGNGKRQSGFAKTPQHEKFENYDESMDYTIQSKLKKS